MLGHSPIESARELCRAGQLEEAADLLRKYLQSQDDDGECWELLGVIRHEQRSHSLCVQAIEVATILKPLSVDAQLALGESYRQLGDSDSARCIFAHLASLESLPEALVADVVRACGSVGDFRNALALCRSASSRDPECDQAIYGVAYYMSKCGFPADRVAPVVRRAVHLAPDNVRYRLALATLCQVQGDDEGGLAAIANLSVAEIAKIGCANCLRKISQLFEHGGDAARRDACQCRIEQLA